MVSLFLIAGTLVLGDESNTPGLHVEHDGQGYQVRAVLNGNSVLASPPESLWSIATDWMDSWPAS